LIQVPSSAKKDASVDTVALTERDGRTNVSVLCEYGLREHRGGVIAPSIEAGMRSPDDAL
jgi:hypothetical protein